MKLIDTKTGKVTGEAHVAHHASPEAVRCSFCGRGVREVGRLVGGIVPGAHICRVCIAIGIDLLRAEGQCA